MKLKPGISFNLAAPAAKVADYVSIAEDRGFEGIAWLTDSQLIWRDVYVCMTLALERTKKFSLATGVTNPITRDPSVTAGVMASLDEFAPGRVVMGMGVGDSSVHTLHRPVATLAELRKAVLIIRGLLRGEEVPLDGKKIRIPWAGRRKVPIFIASTGPKSLRLAGEVADGVLINVGSHPSLIKWALEYVEEGAKSAGRRLKDLDIWARIHCYPDEDEEKAIANIKGAAATKANGLARYAKDQSFKKHLSKELIKDLERLSKGYNYYEHERLDAKHADLVSRRIINDLEIAGKPAYCIDRLDELMKETGLNQLSFATYGYPDIPGYLKNMASDVMASLR